MAVRWGVAGTGAIADKVMRDLLHVPNAVLTAVGSRSAERAEAFAAAHAAHAGHGQVPRAHGSYRGLLDDPDVDVVYLATPHPQHRALALAALAAGKAILVEKSFTVTPAATREVVAAAGAAGRFAMEAMWTRFCPAVVRLRELVADGAIGEVCTVTANLGLRHPVDPATQSYNPELGDGLLFHLGVYPVSFAQMLLGTPEAVVAHGVLHESGVDVEESVLLRYPGGRSALLFASLRSPAPGEARVLGTTGWIQVPPRFHYPNRIVLYRDGHAPETIDAPLTGAGYTHELVEVTERVAGGHTESEIMPLADTVAVQDVLGEIADQLDIRVVEGPAELP
ncbi:Gfo/Idh/MocA family protein [Thermoactinospora rubra]|uniref:Gfo/Idh/MocA family protein n=1 Tax=Thermoactinospora rubra TaxID=1088767 RepID=UPI000A10E152|nr:Gfo/Idh/MocA family oxidoreductase [Thermoactinospora rubra]